MKLNEKGQCPECHKKPLTYKRDGVYYCTGCSREFNLQTGEWKANYHWDAPCTKRVI